MLVNGRISSRSYPRYRLARPFFRRVLAPRRSLLHAERRVGAAHHRHRRRAASGSSVTGSLKFDSLEIPGQPAASADRGRNRVLRYFRIAAGSPGHHRRQHARRAKRSRCSSLPAHSRDDDRTRCSIIAPRKPERFDEAERLARRAGWNVARRTELRVDAEPRQRRRHPRHHRRAGAALPDRDRGLRRRQPRRRWRPQYPGAGRVREANRLWSAHAELRRDRADVPRQRRRDPGARRRASSSRRCSICSAIRFGARRLGAAARALVEANRGARDKSSRRSPQLLPPDESRPSVVRPFRRL